MQTDRPRGGPAIDVASTETRSGRRLPPWIPPLLWAALVLGVSSIQDLRTSDGTLDLRDKLAHFGEYFVFGWLVARAFDGKGWSGRKHFLWTMLFGLYLAGFDEFYQGFVPGRESSLLDVVADLAGTLAGWYFSREDEVVGEAHGPPGHP